MQTTLRIIRRGLPLIAVAVISLHSAPRAAVAAGSTTQTVQLIQPAHIGEFFSISGTVAVVVPPHEPRAPYGFLLEDRDGNRIKVCIWKDIFSRIDNRDLLQTTGSLVHMTAQVVEYKDKLELHVQDWEEIDVLPQPAATPADATTTATLTATTDAPTTTTSSSVSAQ